MNQKILLVPDVEGWIWWHQSQAIQKYAPSRFDVTVGVQQELYDNKQDKGWVNQWDAILHWSWIDAPYSLGLKRLVTVVAHEGIRWEYVENNDTLDTTPHMLQWASASPRRNISNAKELLPCADAVIGVNENIANVLWNSIGVPRCQHVPVGIDHQMYRPIKNPWSHGGKLRVGWCGQAGARAKGYEWILEPLMQAVGDRVTFVTNRRTHLNAMTAEEMVTWYNHIDIFLCTSICEGTPSTALEAMACGRGVISTHVGVMPEVFRDRPGGILVPGYTNDAERQTTIQALAETLTSLSDIKVRCMGACARRRILECYTWEELAPRWLEVIAG